MKSRFRAAPGYSWTPTTFYSTTTVSLCFINKIKCVGFIIEAHRRPAGAFGYWDIIPQYMEVLGEHCMGNYYISIIT